MLRVEENLARITGQNWKIRCEMREQLSDGPIVPLEPVAPPQEVPRDPLVDKAQAAFDARLLRLDDGFGAKRESEPSSADEPDWQDQEEV